MRKMLMILFMLAPTLACAAESEQERLLAAAETFNGLAAEAQTHDDMPRLSDPQAREALEILANTSNSFGTAAFPSDELESTLAVCEAVTKARDAYGAFGLDAFMQDKWDKGLLTAKSDKAAISALVAELGLRNMVRFQNEVFLLMDFNERCIAAELPLLAEFHEKLPPEQRTEIRMRAVRGLQASVKKGMIAAVGMLTASEISEDIRRRNLETMARLLPGEAAILPLAERASLRRDLETMKASVPKSFHDIVDGMLTSLDDTSCKGLCRF